MNFELTINQSKRLSNILWNNGFVICKRDGKELSKDDIANLLRCVFSQKGDIKTSDYYSSLK